jgi:hypothetical protein
MCSIWVIQDGSVQSNDSERICDLLGLRCLRQFGRRQSGTTGRLKPCPRRCSRATTWRSLGYGAIAFNWPRPGVSLAPEDVETWIRET